MLHVRLFKEYSIMGFPTDSFKKVTTAMTSDNTLQFPRWLFDITREIARPMIAGHFALIPWLDANFPGDSGTLPGLGLTPDLMAKAARMCSYMPPESLRQILEETLIPAEVTLFDGGYGYVSEDLPLWRKEAVEILRPLVNGAKVFDLKRTGLPRPILSRRRVDDIDLFPFTTRERLFNDDDISIHLSLHDTWRVSEPVDIFADVHDDDLEPAAGRTLLEAASLFLRGERIINGRFVFYLDSSVAERMATLNAWFTERMACVPGLREINRHYMETCEAIRICLRFPCDVRFSRTPRTSGVFQHTPRPPQNSKVKGKRRPKGSREGPPGTDDRDPPIPDRV
jgi:hypothetical protein